MCFRYEGRQLSDLHSKNVQILYNQAYWQYVLLFHADTVSFDYNGVGVAVSASVTGPYAFVRTFHPDGLGSYDMGVFQVCFPV